MNRKQLLRCITDLKQSRISLYYAVQRGEREEAETQREIQRKLVKQLNDSGRWVVMTHFDVYVLPGTQPNRISNL